MQSDDFAPVLFSQAANQIRKLYKMFIDVDATQIEVNPFGETDDGRGMYAIINGFKFLFRRKDAIIVNYHNTYEPHHEKTCLQGF